MDKISVLILSYNLAAYIREAVLSVLKQKGVSFDQIEIVIVEDGSTDNSMEVIEGIIREYPGIINLVDLKRNSGIMPAAMEGLKHLSGNYVCLLDADDAWHKNKLSEVIPCFEEGYDIVLHEGEFVDSSSNYLKSSKCYVRDEDIANRIRTFNGGVPLGSCVSFRRSKLDENRLSIVYDNFKKKNLERDLHDDICIIHNILSCKDARVKCVRKNLYRYRIHGDNTFQHTDFYNMEKTARTYKQWLANVSFGVETYKLSGIYHEDKSIEIGLQKFIYYKNLTFREKSLLELWKDYLFLLRNNAFLSRNEKIRGATYPFFYRLPSKIRSFVRSLV